MSKAVVFFAEGTEECEALLVVDLLRRAKVDVTVASASGSREILSSHKIRITADALAEEVDYSDVDLVVLPGGIPGTPNLAANKTVTDTCTAFAKSGKKVAAICAAPSVLASLGLLEGKNATAHAGFQDKLAGAHVLDAEVVVDGNITTLIAAIILSLKGSGSVKGFAHTLALSIVVSMFTALVIPRLVMNAFYALGLQDAKLYGIQKERKTINFLSKKNICFVISAVLILGGLAVMIKFRIIHSTVVFY